MIRQVWTVQIGKARNEMRVSDLGTAQAGE